MVCNLIILFIFLLIVVVFNFASHPEGHIWDEWLYQINKWIKEQTNKQKIKTEIIFQIADYRLLGEVALTISTFKINLKSKMLDQIYKIKFGKLCWHIVHFILTSLPQISGTTKDNFASFSTWQLFKNVKIINMSLLHFLFLWLYFQYVEITGNQIDTTFNSNWLGKLFFKKVDWLSRSLHIYQWVVSINKTSWHVESYSLEEIQCPHAFLLGFQGISVGFYSSAVIFL